LRDLKRITQKSTKRFSKNTKSKFWAKVFGWEIGSRVKFRMEIPRRILKIKRRKSCAKFYLFGVIRSKIDPLLPYWESEQLYNVDILLPKEQEGFSFIAAAEELEPWKPRKKTEKVLRKRGY